MAAHDARREYDEPWRSERYDENEERRGQYGRESRWRQGREGEGSRENWNEPYGRGAGSRSNEPESWRTRQAYGRSEERYDEPYNRSWNERFGRERDEFRNRGETEPFRRSGDFDRENWMNRSTDYGRESWTGRSSEFDRDRWQRRSEQPFYGFSTYGSPEYRSTSGYGTSGYGSSYSGERSGQSGETGRTGRTGMYRGRGPRGYHRSDERIREDVNDRLTDHPFIDASDIEVDVNDGEVTLKGEVEERNDKRLAEDIVESISGVREVHNNIRVRNRNGGRYFETGSRYQTGSMMGGRMLRMHMEVRGSDGQRVGEVKEMHGDEFILDRPNARDLYVPMHSVSQIFDDHVQLNVPSDRVDDMGWQTTEMMGGGRREQRQ